MERQSTRPGEAAGDADLPATGGSRVLHTSRLVLRPPVPRDAPAFAALADNPRIAEQTARMPYPYREQDALAWIGRLGRLEDQSAETGFAILQRESGALIGAAGFGGTGNGAEAEIGYWLGEPHWGNGYATEAAWAVIGLAFTALALDRFLGRCRVGNEASYRVLMKCGFHYAGGGMMSARALPGPVPADHFLLARSRWENLKREGAA